ncbi:hypothetical protein B0T25DRAFT_226756 [Lasiosphaeria hispida]|uniref:Secreted protein n=1 Tax=Lasiosphaeria hispida TaxID=260671 RepID=A0AAJ0MBK2_9PEZI|nr:hypothetical protein B0T25DRAFT_226756 [Lasiosphaeria hispida]
MRKRWVTLGFWIAYCLTPNVSTPLLATRATATAATKLHTNQGEHNTSFTTFTSSKQPQTTPTKLAYEPTKPRYQRSVPTTRPRPNRRPDR